MSRTRGAVADSAPLSGSGSSAGSAGSAVSPRALLASAREARARVLRAEADLIQVAYQWAVSHPLEPDDTAWIAAGKAAAVTGDGAPDFDELSVAELAAALGMSTPAGVRLVTDAVDLAHRHPRLWARVRAGNLPCWRARKVAQATALLSARAAGYVDAEIAPVADRVGSTRLARLVEEAIARFDPDIAAEAFREAQDTRGVKVEDQQVSFAGTMRVAIEADLADVLDLDEAVAVDAARQAAAGCGDPLQVRRARAVGAIARCYLGRQDDDIPAGTPVRTPDPATATHPDPTTRSHPDPATPVAPHPDAAPLGAAKGGVQDCSGRRVVLHVHLPHDALDADAHPGTAVRVEERQQVVTLAQVRSWCGPGARVTVVPVVDLEAHHDTDGYRVPGRISEQAALRDQTCVFPWCQRPARRCDCDHVVPHARGGPTCSCNIAPLCRRHHRLKTHTGWDYAPLDPGVYHWRSPHGLHYLRDRTGTREVTPSSRSC